MKSLSPFIARCLLLYFVLFFLFPYGVSAWVITPITSDGIRISHENPAIDANQIVWSDNRDGGSYATYLYNANTGIETQISPATSFSSQFPRISKNLVVYQEDSNILPVIYLYNISSKTTTQITSDPNGQFTPAIFGNRIVWSDSRNGISNIFINGTTPGMERALSPSGSDQSNPDIFNDLVVWQDKRNSNWDIYLYNITSQKEIQITSDSSDQTFPAIYGERIVWMDNRNGIHPEIFINGTSQGDEYSITPDGQADDHSLPSIFGTKIVWQQGNTKIYMNDTGLLSSSLIPIDINPGSFPAVPKISYDPNYGDRVVWQEKSSGNDIYLYTSGVSGTCPVADFTHDFRGGAAPATVHFFDQSTSGASHWFWDFGDGSNSILQNATHTFLKDLPYDVSLTTGNPACRNTSRKMNNVIVGRPVADFSADSTSDIVPAAIHFHDQSSGTPTTWFWEFGDGSNSTQQNPTYTYTSVGTYSVNLTVTNAFGSSVKTRVHYINVLKGFNEVASTTIHGLTVTNCAGAQSIIVDTSLLPAALIPNNSVLEIQPPADRGFRNVTIYSFDSIGFTRSGTIIAGNITGVRLETRDIIPIGFAASVGSPVSVRYSVDLSSYPCNAGLNTRIWESALSEDSDLFKKIAIGSHFSHYSETAYTTKITKTNFPSHGSVTFHMSVNSTWVSSIPDGRNQVFIERISDDRTIGEVLDTRYKFSDPVKNLDYFEAESPHGLSTFGLSSLTGAGNPFQLITLTVASHISPPDTGNDDYSPPGSGAGAGKAISPATVQTANPQKAPVPVDPGKTEKIYTNAQGVITQVTRLESTDQLAQISIDLGVVAKDRSGAPLSSVTLASLPAESLPTVASAEGYSFSGMAYEFSPDGATFSPAVSLSFIYPGATWGEEYTAKSFDHQSGTWQDLPTTRDPDTGRITAQVSHFCTIALFAKSTVPYRSVAVTPTIMPVTLKAPPAPPAPTAISNFIGMMIWIADLMAQNILLITVIIILAVSVFLFGRKRRRDKLRYLL